MHIMRANVKMDEVALSRDLRLYIYRVSCLVYLLYYAVESLRRHRRTSGTKLVRHKLYYQLRVFVHESEGTL